jgi:RHS repeat-associated protein
VINGNGKILTFGYDAFRQRFSQDYSSNGVHEITQYVGDLLEKVTAGGVIDWRHYIQVGDRTVAIMSRQNPGTNATRYILPDDQGSIAKITNSAGTTDVSENFSPCGTRRDPTTWSGSPACPDLVTIRGISREGFNGQDAIGGVSMGLNHMLGRVQDAITGKFLSADPFVFEPGSTQAWNRYSYVYNNPMSFTDPSGFFGLCFTEFFGGGGDFGGGFGGEGGGGFGDGGFGGGGFFLTFCFEIPDQFLLPPPNLDTQTYRPPSISEALAQVNRDISSDKTLLAKYPRATPPARARGDRNEPPYSKTRNILERTQEYSTVGAIGHAAQGVVEVGKGALEAGAMTTEVREDLAKHDYDTWKNTGTHVYPRFEGYDWRGDTWEEAKRNRYEDYNR